MLGRLDVGELPEDFEVLGGAVGPEELELQGLSITGETEEQIRAESEAEIRKLVDAFIDSVKENVPDEITRERIRRSLMDALPGDDGEEDGV